MSGRRSGDSAKRRATRPPSSAADVAAATAIAVPRRPTPSAPGTMLLRIVLGTVALALIAVVVTFAMPSTGREGLWSDHWRKQLELTDTKRGGARSQPPQQQQQQQQSLGSVEVLAVYPHDAGAFTQGLLVAQQGADKFFIESTGLYGQSSLRKVAIPTGEVLARFDVDAQLFGEGVTLNPTTGELVMLTWKSQRGLVFDLSTVGFALKREFTFATVTGEGWGIDNDGAELVVSDGSSTLQFWDPQTRTETRRITVTYGGREVPQLNELEVANGYIYANVWYQYAIIQIDPQDGRVVRVFDCTALAQQAEATADPNAVLNGIAYDGDEDVFYLTGKLWKKVFKVRFVE